jgi:anionic cell wall polymer biosynthesis LytR-Cps2A-Psr (LCP) family protein
MTYIIANSERKAQGGGSRSDTIMILSINPKEKKTEIVSVPRVS